MASTSIPFSLAMQAVNQVAEVCGYGGYILNACDVRQFIAGDRECLRSVASILKPSAKQSFRLSDEANPDVIVQEYARLRHVISMH